MSQQSERIYEGITNIDDTIIEEAQAAMASDAEAKVTDTSSVQASVSNSVRKHRPRRWWMSAVAAVLVAAVALGVFLRPGNISNKGSLSAYALAEPEYPQMPSFPTDMNAKDYREQWKTWVEAVRKQGSYPVPDSLSAFTGDIASQYLGDTEGQNCVVSPVNLYLALSLLAELTDADSRTQILSLLGTSDLHTLRQNAGDIWNACYRDDGSSSSILANSIWLNDRISFKQKTMDTLADKYYASSYRGTMGSAEFNKELQDWINRQTAGLLEKQAAADVHMDPSTVMALVSAIQFKATWDDEFNKNATDTGIFHAAGGDISCEMMHGSADTYYRGEHFSAVSRRLAGSMGDMYFILPDEGVRIDDLLSDEEALGFLGHRADWENCSWPQINLSVPKFDVASDLDLIDGLIQLGVSDVFNSAVSDFTPMTDDVKDVYVSEAKHAARVGIDEEGVIAAAYTLIYTAEGAAAPTDIIDFVIDRPFLFVIAGPSDQTLFVGVVNQP